jgi:branched-chain amino acid transport system substrate-binding protein
MSKKIMVWWVLGVAGLIAAAPGVAEETVKIALIRNLTGLGSSAKQHVWMGGELAVAEINQRGGVLGRPLEVIQLDDQSTPIGAKQAALQAIQAQVAGVVGLTWSSLALAAAPDLQAAGIPVVSSSATHPQVTHVGDYIFRVCFSDTLQGKVLAQLARDDLQAQTAVILVNTSDDYSLGLAQMFRDIFTQAGGAILWEGQYRKETLDFQDLLQHIAQLKPDVTFLPGHSRDSALIARQAANLGIHTQFLGGDAWQQIAQDPEAIKAVEGAYFTSHWHPDVTSSQSQHLKTIFRAQYGEDLFALGPVLTYDAVLILADAIQRAQSLDRQAIRDALAATQNFIGASGTITFDANRDPINKEMVILTFKNGQIVFVKTIKPQ